MRVALFVLLSLSLAVTSAAAQIAATQMNTRDPIEIVANTLDVQHDRRTATFAGNVNATQGVLLLRADKLLVAYATGGAPNAINRLDATGRVFLSTPQETAQGATATYDVGAGIITLTGTVVLTRGENVLRGERLVLNLATGTSRMEGGAGAAGGDGRVRGLFVPTEPGAPAP
ncbi:MAG: lipopolysaccharide transport periplasmic protein LptA [Alphaproteobacteria bacterium]|nr:lipopolysaccharide transport periplasmic protein LptA [Alphaproteobacteria bacterium]